MCCDQNMSLLCFLKIPSLRQTEEKNKSKKKGGERSWGKDLIISIKAQMMVTERLVMMMMMTGVMLKMLQTQHKKKNKDPGQLWGDDVLEGTGQLWGATALLMDEVGVWSVPDEFALILMQMGIALTWPEIEIEIILKKIRLQS